MLAGVVRAVRLSRSHRRRLLAAMARVVAIATSGRCSVLGVRRAARAAVSQVAPMVLVEARVQARLRVQRAAMGHHRRPEQSARHLRIAVLLAVRVEAETTGQPTGAAASVVRVAHRLAVLHSTVALLERQAVRASTAVMAATAIQRPPTKLGAERVAEVAARAMSLVQATSATEATAATAERMAEAVAAAELR